MAKEQMMTYSVRVALPESAIRGHEDELQKLVQALVTQKITGGLMLSAHDVNTLQSITGVRVGTADDVIKAVNQGTPLKDGGLRAVVTVDPAFIAPLKTYCEMARMSVDDFISSAWNLCVSQGYLFTVPVPSGPMYLSEPDRLRLDKLMGTRGYTLTDVVDALEKAALVEA